MESITSLAFQMMITLAIFATHWKIKGGGGKVVKGSVRFQMFMEINNIENNSRLTKQS